MKLIEKYWDSQPVHYKHYLFYKIVNASEINVWIQAVKHELVRKPANIYDWPERD